MKQLVAMLMALGILIAFFGVGSAEIITIDTEHITASEIVEIMDKLKELLIMQNGGYEPGLTLENYNRIETGMTYEMVVAIFGEPGVVQMEMDLGLPEYKTVNYQWGAGFEYCAISFQGGKVAMKMQFGLK